MPENVMNKCNQSGTTDKGWSSCLGTGRGDNSPLWRRW